MKKEIIKNIDAKNLLETLQNIDIGKHGFEDGDKVCIEIDTDNNKILIQPYLEAKIGEIKELDQEIFEIQKKSNLFEIIHRAFDSKYAKTYKSLHFILASMTALKLGIFELCKQQNLYSVRAQFRIFIEHFLKLNYIFFRFNIEKNDDVGNDYEVYADAEDPMSFARSISQIQQLISGDIKNDCPNFFELLCKKTEKYHEMDPQEVQRKVSQFKNFNILKYIMNNVLEDINNTEVSSIRDTLLGFIPDYAEFSSYVHGGPGATIKASIECMTKNEIDECVKLANSTMNIYVGSLLMVCVTLGITNKEAWDILNKIKLHWQKSEKIS